MAFQRGKHLQYACDNQLRIQSLQLKTKNIGCHTRRHQKIDQRWLCKTSDVRPSSSDYNKKMGTFFAQIDKRHFLQQCRVSEFLKNQRGVRESFTKLKWNGDDGAQLMSCCGAASCRGRRIFFFIVVVIMAGESSQELLLL
jgi:hypothetical protein